MSRLRRAFGALGLVEDTLLVAAFWMLGLVVFAQFFTRYFLGTPLGWTEELARYLLIAVCFLGLPVAARRGEHIRIDLLQGFLGPRTQPVLQLILEFLQLLLVLVLMRQAWQLANLSPQSMTSLPLPKSLIYYAVLLGLALHLVTSLARFAAAARTLAGGRQPA